MISNATLGRNGTDRPPVGTIPPLFYGIGFANSLTEIGRPVVDVALFESSRPAARAFTDKVKVV